MFKKISLIYFVLSGFVSAAVSTDASKTFLDAFVAGYNQYNQSTPLLREDVKEFNELSGRGNLACGLYKIDLRDGASIICKGGFAAHVEADNFQLCDRYLDEYTHKTDTSYPQFARFCGHFESIGFVTPREASDKLCFLYGMMKRTILLFHKAEGIPLSDLFLKKPIDESLIKSIGGSIAHFHLYSRESDRDVFKAYLHRDLHVDNIFVKDAPVPVVTLIDYDELANSLRLGRADVSSEIGWFFLQSRKALSKRVPADDEGVQTCFRLFAQGYNQALAVADVPFKILDDESGLTKI